MEAPKLWYVTGYGNVTLEVFETILDSHGVQQHLPNIIRDSLPPIYRAPNVKIRPHKEQK